MKVLILNPDIVLRVTAELSIYTEAPFLAPMRDGAMKAHLTIQKAYCKSCTRRSSGYRLLVTQVARAFIRLIADESKKTPNLLTALKASMSKILNTTIEEVQVSYVENDGTTVELKF